MPTKTLKPPRGEYRKRIARRQEGKPTCICPGCTRPAAMFSPQHWGELARQAWCSTTCQERWKQLQPKDHKK